MAVSLPLAALRLFQLRLRISPQDGRLSFDMHPHNVLSSSSLSHDAAGFLNFSSFEDGAGYGLIVEALSAPPASPGTAASVETSYSTETHSRVAGAMYPDESARTFIAATPPPTPLSERSPFQPPMVTDSLEMDALFELFQTTSLPDTSSHSLLDDGSRDDRLNLTTMDMHEHSFGLSSSGSRNEELPTFSPSHTPPAFNFSSPSQNAQDIQGWQPTAAECAAPCDTYGDRQIVQKGTSTVRAPAVRSAYAPIRPQTEASGSGVQRKPPADEGTPPVGGKTRKPRRLPCSYIECPRRFTTEYTRRVHERTHQTQRVVSLPCTMGCAETFSRQHDRLRHEVAQHGKVCDYTCARCGGFFSAEKHLDIHLRKCRGEKKKGRWNASNSAERRFERA